MVFRIGKLKMKEFDNRMIRIEIMKGGIITCIKKIQDMALGESG